MAEDGSPKIYSGPPRESSKTPTEAAVPFGADNTIQRSEATITSEGDHVTPASEHPLEGDFSTKEKPGLEDAAETRIKSPVPEKEIVTPTETTNSTASEVITENFIPVKIGSISTPVGTVSLIDFPSTLAKEDILLAVSDAGGEESSPMPELSRTPENSTNPVEDTPALHTEKAETDVTIYTSSINSKVPDDGTVHVTESSIPEAEISPSMEKDFTNSPDITDLAQEKANESGLTVSEDEPGAGTKLTGKDEKFITVFELTNSVEKDKGSTEEGITDDESPDGTNAWVEKEMVSEAETPSVLLTAVESRYDFITPAPRMKSFRGDCTTTTAQDLPENAAAEAVMETTEPLAAEAPGSDMPDRKEEASAPKTGVFKLLKEDPDEFMM